MEIFKKHPQWKDVLEICKTLSEKGFTAWLAGGCVRDALRGALAHDFDVATNATSDQVVSIFPKTVEVGKAFGVVRVIQGQADIEVASFRRDGPYSDGRRPDSVTQGTPEEDAQRRDFTMNALFFDPITDKIYDFVQGQKDITHKLIRTVGDPLKRFEEDKLRPLRALRFMSQLGFEIDPGTLHAISLVTDKLKQVSHERVEVELGKLFGGPSMPQAMDYFESTGVRAVLFPSVKPLRKNELMEALGKDFQGEVVWLLLLKDLGQDDVEEILDTYHFSNKDKERLLQGRELIQKLQIFSKLPVSQKRRIAAHGACRLALSYATCLGVVSQECSDFIKKAGPLPAPFLNGDDLLKAGVRPGKVMGQILEEIYDLQLEGKLISKDKALEVVKERVKTLS